MKTPDVCITLVHGTWGRGFFPDRQFHKGVKGKPFWFEDESLFRTRLSSSLESLGISYKIKTHEWSGANSILERAKIAKQLAAQLQASRAEYPHARQVVIAHSHGGNVVRLALEELSDRGKIFVVTMATPFVEINRTSPLKWSAAQESASLFGRPDLDVIATSCYYSTLFLMIFCGIAFYSFLYFILSMVLSLVFTLLVCFLWFRLVANATKTDQLVNATRSGMNWYDVSTFVIRAVDDEASLSLALGAIGNRISLALVKAIVWVRNMHIISKKGMALGLLISAAPALLYVCLSERYALYLAILMTFGPGLITLICVLASGVFKSVYGRELFLGSLLCEVNCHSAPDQGESVSVVTLSKQSEDQRGLRHSIYDNEKCTAYIAMLFKTMPRSSFP